MDQKRIRTYKTDAIILSQRQFGETDKLITVFSKEHGKKTIIAKGILKSTSPLIYHLDNMNLARLVMSKGKNLDLVTQASVGTVWVLPNPTTNHLRPVGFCDLTMLRHRSKAREPLREPIV